CALRSLRSYPRYAKHWTACWWPSRAAASSARATRSREASVELLVDPRGQVRCLYTECLDLAQLGRMRIRRASRVEPDILGRWWADLSPVRGPRLGPFRKRSEALTAEAAWLEAHWLVPGRPAARPPAA